MRVLFAVSNDNITTSVVNKYQQKYKEIITSKNVYYFNAIIKELQKNKSYDTIVIGEDLEPISNNDYDAIDKFLFEKLDGISDEASKPTGEDIPIIFICSDRRTTSDQLLIKLFGIGIYNAIIGNDRSIDTVCNLINKPRNKKEAKQYYKIESEDVEMYENSNDQDVSETEIQNILSHYKKIGSNVRKCVESFDRITEQYNETQLRVIVNFLPKEVKKILEDHSATYQTLMLGGTVLSNGTYTEYNRQDNKTPNKIDVLTKDLEKTNLSKPVIIPSTININNGANQNIKPNNIGNQNIPNKQIPQHGGMPQTVMQVRPKPNMTNNMQPQNGQMVRNNIQMPNNNANVLNNRNIPNNAQISNNPNVLNNTQITRNTNVPNNIQMQNNTQVPNNAQVQNNTQPINNYKQGVEEKMQSPTNNNNEIGKVVPEITQKRGRGRPRKVVPPVTAPINSLTNIENTPTALTELQPIQPIPSIQPMENTQKRKRGRPSKKSLEDIQNQPNTVLSANNNNEQIITDSNNQMNDMQSLNMPQNDILPGLEGTNETVDLFSMDPIDDSIMDLPKNDSIPSSTTPKYENNIENSNNNNPEQSNYFGAETLSDNSNLFDLDIEETNNKNNENLTNNIDNDINSNPYSDSSNMNLSNNSNNDLFNQTYENANESPNVSPYGNMNDLTYGSLSNPSYRNFNANQYNNANYGNMNNSQYGNVNNPAYANMNKPQYGNTNNNFTNPNMQGNYNNLINTQVAPNTNNNSYARNGKIVSFIGTSKNGVSFIVNNLAQLLSQTGIKTAILDLTKNKNSYYMFTDNDPNLMKKATESMKNLSNGVIDGLNINKNLTVFTSLPDEIETLNDEVMLQTLSNNYEVVLLDCDFSTDAVYFIKSNEIYLVQSMDTFTIQPLTQFLSNLKIQNALDESKLRIVINKYVKLKKLDERMIIGGMSKYNEPSMTLQRDLFNAQTIKYVCIPFEMDTYARYLESIAMCSLSLNGYSQNFINSLEELRKMVFPLIAGGNNNSQNNTEDKHGLFGGKKNKTQQSTQFSNNVNDTLNKMRTNNF